MADTTIKLELTPTEGALLWSLLAEKRQTTHAPEKASELALAKRIQEKIDAATKRPGEDSFRQGFVIGWIECVGNQEPNKKKLKAIAEAAAGNYIRKRQH